MIFVLNNVKIEAENKKGAFEEPLEIMPEQLISGCLHIFLLTI
jgi:hypothetical protein